jgi:hypothetical protein
MEPLPVGVEGDGQLELGDYLAVLAEKEPCVGQGFEGGQAVTLQAAGGDRRERRILDVG